MSNPIETTRGRRPGLVERLGKENVTNYFLLLTAVFFSIGAADLAANILLPALNIMELHSIDGAAAAGGIGLVTGATAVINEAVHS